MTNTPKQYQRHQYKEYLLLMCIGIFGIVFGCGRSKDQGHIDNKNIVSSISQANSLLDQAERYENDKPSYSDSLAKRVLAYALANNLELLEMQSKLQIANILFVKTKFTDAMKISLEVREKAIKSGNIREQGLSYEVIGRIKSKLGDYEQSFDDFFAAVKCFEQLKDLKDKCRVLHAIGSVYYWKKDNDKALQYFEQAHTLAEQIKDSVLIGKTMNGIGVIYMGKKENNKALENFVKALEINLKTRQMLSVGGNYMNAAIVQLNMKNVKESYKSYYKALNIFSQFENYSNLSTCYLNLGNYFDKSDNPDSCMRTTRKCYQISRQYGIINIELEAVRMLHQLYLDKHNIDSAYKYSMSMSVLKDSIQLKKSNTRFSLAELQYQFETKLNDQKLQHQRINLLTISAIITLLALVLIFMLIISRQKQRNKAIALEKKNLKDEIEFKNKELTLNVMNLLKRNESILDTSTRLLNIDPQMQNTLMHDEIIKIAKSLQDESQKRTWEEFDLRFKQVHSGFYERLLVQFPDLTPNELKLCGLLRLNLTTKEIADLTGQQYKTVDMARFRLRKHMGLTDPQVHLINFLAKI